VLYSIGFEFVPEENEKMKFGPPPFKAGLIYSGSTSTTSANSLPVKNERHLPSSSNTPKHL
jgi:hypothetical protein